MLTDEEQQFLLKSALTQALRESGIRASSSVVDFFVARAMNHIRNRRPYQNNFDSDVIDAAKSSRRLAHQMAIFKAGSVTRSFTKQDVRNYLLFSSNCFYPWCKP